MRSYLCDFRAEDWGDASDCAHSVSDQEPTNNDFGDLLAAWINPQRCENSRIPTWAAPAISAAPMTPQMHPNEMALRRPSQSEVTPTDALPSHAVPGVSDENVQGMGRLRTSGLVDGDDGASEGRVGVVEVG